MTYSVSNRSNPSHSSTLCDDAHSVGRHDDQLGLCFQVDVPCGSSDQEAIQNFRRYQSAQNLARNVATRIHQAPSEPRPSVAPVSEESEGITFLGVLEFLLALTPLGWSGCSTAQPTTVPEVPDGSSPPPGFDPECEGRRTTIQTSDPLASTRTPTASDGGSTSAYGRVSDELNRQYPGITLPLIDISYQGFAIFNDSLGNPVSTLQTSDPVSFTRIGNTLYVLTANTVSGGFAPATLLLYDVSASPPRPLPIDSIAHDSMGGPANAIVLGYYNPVAMAPLVGNTEIDILYGAPNAGVVSTVDPFSNRLTEADWCSTHSAIGDGGTERPDASSDTSDSGASDAGLDSSMDAGDASDGSRG